ncbi:sigma-54-dependent Fis family transcriptional regulator [Niveispirillum sp.]|uniref:sigma-54 interaction domain-containing protein n=1 Tax=Niveispirillum sp. TaxID=1917217 RepID=UPI001B73AC8C|nr:sigma-54 dependent transcriptional regulator [Niveispirillum sp.]MBP7338466.1 sigma-54-dependent Fis family transcriptional regulator [Niveispirillum sp.]
MALQPGGREGPPGLMTFDSPGFHSQSIRASAVVFEDPASRQLYDRIGRIGPSEATVLVAGETGTGKELVARLLHRLSARAARPFIAINCAALPENLVESELFGHERGAFTGAVSAKRGWFEAAQHGTLFLDEIGDLPLTMQVKLLRVLQEREISRVGSRAAIPIDVRIIAASHVNLEGAVRAGRFREDLYFRLNVAQIRVPALRERPADILPLARHFLKMYGERLRMRSVGLSPAAERLLTAYAWPGNIRELENVIHHALLVMNGEAIGPTDLNLPGQRMPVETVVPAMVTDTAPPSFDSALLPLFESGAENLYDLVEAKLFQAAYEYCHRNQLQTAKLLGITRNILRHRLKQYGLL